MDLRVIPDKYVFSPYSILGRYLYLNAESTNFLFLARRFWFCTHWRSCADKMIKTYGSLTGMYLFYKLMFKPKEKEDESLVKEVFKGIFFVLMVGTFLMRGCLESIVHDLKD